MLFDIGWPEFLLIGVVALVVIGPKDLPRAMRVAGYWMRKARSLSREFQSSIDQMIREAELDEVRRDLKKAAEFDLEAEFNRTVDPDGSLAHSIKPPDMPDFFTEAEGPPPSPVSAPALPAPDHIAAERLLPPNMSEPEYVGFEPVPLEAEPTPPRS